MPKYSSPKGFEKGLLKTIAWFSKKENLNFIKQIYFRIRNEFSKKMFFKKIFDNYKKYQKIPLIDLHVHTN